MQAYLEQFTENMIKAIPNLLTAVVILIVSIYLARLLGGLLVKVLKVRNADPEVTRLLGQITRWSIIVAGTITALQRFFDVTAFLAGLGIIGFTVGFALQNVMQNFAAGMILLIQQPFNVGDAIEVNGYGGTILTISLRTTEMRTFDGLIVIIPNADVLSNTITNYTRAKLRRIGVPASVSSGADSSKVRSVILEAIRDVPGFVSDPAPVVVFQTFSGSALEVMAYFWYDTGVTNPFAAKDSALERIKATLTKNEIEIPLPFPAMYAQNTEK